MLLPSCLARKIRKVEGNSFDWGLIQARYTDIPIPISAVPDLAKSVISVDQQVVFVFKSKQTLGELVDYYTQQMEHCGWQRAVLSNVSSERVVINFKKPHSYCTVVADRDTVGATVSVHVVGKSYS